MSVTDKLEILHRIDGTHMTVFMQSYHYHRGLRTTKDEATDAALDFVRQVLGDRVADDLTAMRGHPMMP